MNLFDLFISILKNYQTAWSALVGFLGVILTIRYNSKREREAQQSNLENERIAIISALIAELRVMRGIMVDAIEKFKDTDSGQYDTVLMESDPFPADVYDNLIPEIGLLKPETVEKVITAYIISDQRPQKINLMIDGAANSGKYIKIPHEKWDHAAAVTEGVLSQIDLAIAALEGERK